MKEAPEPVLLYIPLMKDLNFTWSEIKNTPRAELEGILQALAQYQNLHSMDGYDDEDVNEIAKRKPAVRSQYAKYLETKRKYYSQGKKPQITSFRQALNK